MVKITRSQESSRFKVEHQSPGKKPGQTLITKTLNSIGPLELVKYLGQLGANEDNIQAAYRSLKVLKSKAIYFNRKMEFFYSN